jgi:hypothetical protein
VTVDEHPRSDTMTRLILLVVLASAVGCDSSKPPTQSGGKAVDVKTTGGTTTTSV